LIGWICIEGKEIDQRIIYKIKGVKEGKNSYSFGIEPIVITI